MATEIQYKFFESVYQEENERYKQLAERAKFYLTIQTAYLAAIAFKFEDIKSFSSAFSIPRILFIAIGLFLVLGVVFTILATRIRDYEAPTNLKDVIKTFGKSPPIDSDFLDDRLVDLAVANERNSVANDKAAAWLTVNGWVLLIAVTLHFVTFILACITQFKQ